MQTIDADTLSGWIGKSETALDQVTTAPLKALSATLDRLDPEPRTGEAIPPLWHWLYFLPVHRQSDIGPDGHARRGGFLPPVPLPRRMWAGSRFEFINPLRVGDAITRTSVIEDIRVKSGKTGPLVFVVVRHEIASATGLALREWHDIVYRDMPSGKDTPPATQAVAPHSDWQRKIIPDSVLLFRYSALTFNGHRIHIDRSYAVNAEGYPGLIVHGPLIATLLLDLLRRNQPDVQVRAFRFKALQPLFDTAPFILHGALQSGNEVKLWAATTDGQLAVDATATLS
ncbi:MAG: acyl-CoA dehydrogenase [Betaproteobacteria bacterium]|nr:acyl-CoA dehydrogenase [Betaproteobacteria bacterium]